MTFFTKIFSFWMTFIFIHNSHAQNFKDIYFIDSKIMFINKNHDVASGYLKIENIGDEDLTLLSISSDFSNQIEIHKMKIENNVMKMLKLNDEITISRKNHITFKQGGMHIMFLNIKKELKIGEKREVYFNFKKVGKLKVLMKVHSLHKKTSSKHHKH